MQKSLVDWVFADQAPEVDMRSPNKNFGFMRATWPPGRGPKNESMIVTRLCLLAYACATAMGAIPNAVAADADAAPKKRTTEEASARTIAQTFSVLARSYDWAIAGSSADKAQCAGVLALLKNANEAQWLPPSVVTSDANEHALSGMNLCGNTIFAHAEKERARAPASDAMTYFTGPRDIGDRNYQLYEVLPTGSKPTHWALLYGEYDEAKLALNSYFDGYRTLDLSNCKMVGGVTVQRLTSADFNYPATPRDFRHGVLSSSFGVFVVVGTEQIAGRYDPAAFRVLNAWRLGTNGKFTQQCAWKVRKSAIQPGEE